MVRELPPSNQFQACLLISGILRSVTQTPYTSVSQEGKIK